jgi:signal transduction histidine kinase
MSLLPLRDAIERFAAGDLDARASEDGDPAAVAFNRMAEGLRATSAASRAALDGIAEPVLVLAEGERVLAANAAARAVLGPGADELAALPEEARSALHDCRDRALAGIDPSEGPIFSYPLDGRPARFSPKARRVLDAQGRALGALLVLRDATRLRLADDLKYDLVATVAHELRTPLTSLHMSIHLCLEQSAGPLTDEQGILLSSAREDCERLRLLADELLDMGRLASGRLPLEPTPSDPESLAQRAYSSFRSIAEDKGIALEFEVPSGLGLVNADHERVHRVFANLLSNALRHTPSGGTVTISATRSDHRCRFTVADTGEGIPREYLGQVFDKFVRGPGRGNQGYGLGLCIARDIVAAHGGEIGVESSLGAGSTFWFTLPQATRP